MGTHIKPHIFQEDIYCKSCNNIQAIAFIDLISKNIKFYPMVLIEKSGRKSLKEYRINIKRVFNKENYDLLLNCPLCGTDSKLKNIPNDWTFSDGSIEIIDSISSSVFEIIEDAKDDSWNR